MKRLRKKEKQITNEEKKKRNSSSNINPEQILNAISIVQRTFCGGLVGGGGFFF